MRNKKGVSTIVVTVILVALVLIAVGIVWAVISNLITRSTSQIDVAGICVGVTVQPTVASCTAGSCDVTVERSGTESGSIGGLKLVFKNSTANSAVLDTDTLTCTGGLVPLVPTKCTGIATGLGGGVNRVESTVYILDNQGNERLCSQTTTFNF